MTSRILTSNILKYGGVVLTLLGIPTLLFDKTPGSEVPLMVGLFFVFISKERKEDERSGSIRFSSMTIAFLISYIVAHFTSYLFTKGIMQWHLTEINHFSIMVFALAIAIFYTRLYLIKD
jgi:hypothetical protein